MPCSKTLPCAHIRASKASYLIIAAQTVGWQRACLFFLQRRQLKRKSCCRSTCLLAGCKRDDSLPVRTNEGRRHPLLITILCKLPSSKPRAFPATIPSRPGSARSCGKALSASPRIKQISISYTLWKFACSITGVLLVR